MTRRLVGLATAAATSLAVGGGATACTIAPGPEGAAPVGMGAAPSGFGTLRQEDVSIGLTSGDLRVLVTPLQRSITHVTAPDTERRLNALVEAHAAPGRGDGSGLFLVTLYSDRPDVAFVPEDVQLISQGFRLRASAIAPLTPTWGGRRVAQREQEMAVYDFGSGVDLERGELVLVYGLVQAAQWTTILPRIQAERARVRTRAGLGQASSP
ncbi:MAG: hypothetical protein FJ207_00915 [Gemmatimonadetes bacterium]|nr:hypothetical protein [Gemmatimonadota bacterium]